MNASVDNPSVNAILTIMKALSFCNPVNLKITINSKIPMEKGLGSSAAFSSAIAGGLIYGNMEKWILGKLQN